MAPGLQARQSIRGGRRTVPAGPAGGATAAAPTLRRSAVFGPLPATHLVLRIALPRRLRRLRPGWLALLVLAAGLGITTAATQALQEADRRQQQLLFDGHVDRVEAEVLRRISRPGDALQALRAAFAARGPMDRASFRAWVEARDLPRDFPGMRGLSFVERVPRERLAAFERAEQAGFPGFRVRDEGSAPELLLVKFIEPLQANAAALGLNLARDNVRREAAARAIDSGELTLSATVTLPQDERRGAGWLLLLPVYRPADARPASAPERREQLLGLLTAPLVAQEILAGVSRAADAPVDFELRDAAGPGAAVFSTVAAFPQAGPARLVEERALLVGGRPLVLRVASQAGAVGMGSPAAVAALLAGGALSIALAAVAWLLLAGRARAEALAHSMTADLQRMAHVVRGTSNAVFGMDPERRITWVNEGFTRITGYSSADALGRTPDELLGHPQSDPAAREELAAAIAAGRGARVEILNRRKDGQAYWSLTEVQPAVDHQGRPNGFLEIALDITQAKEAEARLRASQSLLEQAGEIAGVGGWQIDLESGELTASVELRRIFGVAPQAPLTVEDFLAFFDEPTREQIEEHTRMAILEGRPWDLELPTGVNGGPAWIRTVGRVDRAGGRSVRLVGIVQDVSRRRALEAEVRLQHERLAASEQLLRVVADNLPARVAYWDRERRLRFANRHFLQGAGTTLQEALGRTDMDLLGAQRVTAMASRVEAVLAGQPQQFEREEGDRVRLVHYLPDLEGGQVRGFFVLVLDITELKVARDEALAATRAKSEFLATMSHEMRTPLHGVLSLLRFLMDEPLPDKARRYVELANTSARSLLGLINDLLDLSRIEAGRLELAPADLNLRQLLEEVNMLYTHRASEKGLVFELSVAPQVPRAVHVDGLRLRQVLDNLLSNAVKFTHEGSVRVDVRQCEDGSTAFAVRDTGIGIDAAVLPRLFSRFTQADSSMARRYGGSGLGLSIASALAQLLGGRIEAASTPGQGSTFELVLALPPAHAAPASAGAAAQAQRGLPRRAGRVLVAEDNPVNQFVAREMLQRLGVDTIDIAPDGAEAVRMAGAAAYDLVLMDGQMPHVDGYEATRRLRAAGLRMPVVALTASAMAGERERCREAGMDGFMSKPIDPAQLLAVLDRYLPRGPGTAERPAFESKELADRFAAYPGMRDKVLALFARHAPVLIEQLRTAVRDGPREEVFRLAHSARGSAAQVSATAMAHAAGELEAAAKAADADLQPLLGAVEAAYQRFNEAVGPP